VKAILFLFQSRVIDQAGGYTAHHLKIVEKETENPGVVTGWFYFDKPTEINEIRVYMRDLKTGDTVKEISYPIFATWAE